MSANRFKDALEDMVKADKMSPNEPKYMHRLARIYTSLGRPDEALETYGRIQPPAAATDMAPAQKMQMNIKHAKEAVKSGASGSIALMALGQAENGLGSGVTPPREWKLLKGEAYLILGDANSLSEAQNIAVSLLRFNSQDPDAMVLRGRTAYAEGDNQRAIQFFKQARQLDPDYKEALKYMRMVKELDSAKESGNNAFKGGHYQVAVDLYTNALEVDPTNKGTNSKLLQNRAAAYIKLKEYTKAIADCTRAVELDRSYTKARRTKAKALGLSGNWEEAVRELKAIGETNPSEPGLAKEIRDAELELKKSKRKDWYKILGVSNDAGDAEIKRAYKKLAMIHHPDKNPDNEEAAEKFKEVCEAQETLLDPE
jgi:DnaJ family protein C protein 7